MRRAYLAFCIAALTVLSGCARARITTEIKAKGAWTRTLSFTGQEKKEGQMGPSLDDVFVIPSGAAWKGQPDEIRQGFHQSGGADAARRRCA